MFNKNRFKNATVIDASKLAAKYDSDILKAEVDKLGIDQLVPAPVDLSKLSAVVKMMLLENAVYD